MPERMCRREKRFSAEGADVILTMRQRGSEIFPRALGAQFSSSLSHRFIVDSFLRLCTELAYECVCANFTRASASHLSKRAWPTTSTSTGLNVCGRPHSSEHWP